MFAATMALAADDPAAAVGHLEVLRARLPEGRTYLFQHWLATWLAAGLALYRGHAEGADQSDVTPPSVGAPWVTERSSMYQPE
jgi:hypothetical protein